MSEITELSQTKQQLDKAIEKDIKAKEQAALLAEEGGQASIPYAEGMSQAMPAPARSPADGVDFTDPNDRAMMANQMPRGLVVDPALKAGLGMEAQAAGESEKQIKGFANQYEEQAKQYAQASQAELEAKNKADSILKSIQQDQEERAKMPAPEARSYFANKSTWQKLVGGLGMMLSAINPQSAQNALKLIDKEIERDLDAQKAKLESKDKAIAGKMTSYKMYLDKYKDENQARTAAKLDALQQLKTRAEYTASITNSKVMQAKAVQAAGLAQQHIDQLNQNLAIEMTKAGVKSGLSGLSGEEKKRYDLVKEGYQAALDMKRAYDKGDNTFSVAGDNDYTFAEKRFIEAIGRLNSGGVIGADEVKNFKAMLAGPKDSTEIQKKKLNFAIQQMEARLRTLGANPNNLYNQQQLGFKAKS